MRHMKAHLGDKFAVRAVIGRRVLPLPPSEGEVGIGFRA